MVDKIASIEYLRRNIPDYVQRTGEVLDSNEFEAYLVGGSVRDLLLGKIPSDFDIATNASPQQVESIFPKAIATGAKFGTITVVMEDKMGERHNVEVTTYRSESDYYGGRWPSKVEFTKDIKEDLSRRDFTINALAINLNDFDDQGATFDELIFDIFEGLDDLDNGIIRAVGDPLERFKEDGLRPVRACRLASQLNFKIEEKTFSTIKEVLAIVGQISIERFRDELMKILMKSPKPSKGIRLLYECGILEIFIPELLRCVGVNQPEYHVEDVFDHTLNVVDLAQDEVKLAALFHDIGKPDTYLEDKTGVHFFKHDIVGAEMTKKIMTRLKFSNKEIEQTVNLVRHHMFYYPSADWRKAQNISEDYVLGLEDLEKLEKSMAKVVGGWSDGAVRRFISRVGGINNINDLIKLRIADATANPKSTFSTIEIDALEKRIAHILEQDSVLKITDLVINGDDLKQIGIEDGPTIGAILRELLELVLDDPLLNEKESLLTIVKQKYLS